MIDDTKSLVYSNVNTLSKNLTQSSFDPAKKIDKRIEQLNQKNSTSKTLRVISIICLVASIGMLVFSTGALDSLSFIDSAKFFNEGGSRKKDKDSDEDEATETSSSETEAATAPTETVALIDISTAQVGGELQLSYTGDQLRPSFTVSMNDAQLVEGTDYTFAYDQNNASDSICAGPYSITVSGQGAYTGTLTVNYNIVYSGELEFCSSGSNSELAAMLQRLSYQSDSRYLAPNTLAILVNSLLNHEATVLDVLRQYMFSYNMQGLGLSESEYIDVVYVILSNRHADEGGMSMWLNGLSNGTYTEDTLLINMLASPEMSGHCVDWGVNTMNEADQALVVLEIP